MPNKISGYKATQPPAPLKGSTGSNTVTDKTSGDGAGAVAASSTSDTVKFTGSAVVLQKLGEAVAQTPVVDAAKAVSSGTYQIDSSRVADKLLQFENGLK